MRRTKSQADCSYPYNRNSGCWQVRIGLFGYNFKLQLLYMLASLMVKLALVAGFVYCVVG